MTGHEQFIMYNFVFISDKLGAGEIAILKTHLPLNLNSDDAAFRNQLSASIHNAIVRIRDRKSVV